MDCQEPLEIPPLPPEPAITLGDRVQAFFEVVLISGGISSVLASLPFVFASSARESLLANVHRMLGFILIEALLTLAFLLLVLRAHRQKFSSLGFSSRRWPVEAAIGVAIVPLFFLVNVLISVFFQHLLPAYFLKRNPLTDLIRTPVDLALFIGTVLVAGGIKEELQRAFILRRFEVYLGGSTVGLILWSILFGLGHYVQGAQGVVAATLFGMMFGIVYLRRGNLIAPIVAHGLYDSFALLGYWFFTARG